MAARVSGTLGGSISYSTRWPKCMNDSSKKHHYVPQAILRRFSSNSAQTQLYVFDKKRKISFPSSIRDAGSENHFNTVELEGEIVSFEGLFQTNDDELARLIEIIVSNRSLAALAAEDKDSLSEVVAAQIVRTKLLRSTFRSIAEQLQRSIREAGLNPSEVHGVSIPSEQEVRRAALASFLDLSRIVAGIRTKRAILFRSSVPMSIWISDNPVVLYNSFPYGERGISSPGVEIYFPISAEMVIGFYCPSIEHKIRQLVSLKHPDLNRAKYTKIYGALMGGESAPIDLEACLFLNSLQVHQSSRFLYSPRNEFEQASNLLERHPESQDVQSLISVGSIGQGPPPRASMPSGLWVVFYGTNSHHMIEIDTWDESSEFLEFKTYDILTLQAVVNDQPIEQAVLFQDGYERRGMREVKIKVEGNNAPVHVCVSHQNDALNQILRSAGVGRPTSR